jgi:hypothetical protein
MNERCVRPTSAHPRILERAPIVSCGDRVSSRSAPSSTFCEARPRQLRETGADGVFTTPCALWWLEVAGVGRFRPVLRCALAPPLTPLSPTPSPRVAILREKSFGSGRDRFASARRENVRGSAIRGVFADSSVPLSSFHLDVRARSCEHIRTGPMGPTVAMPLRQRYVVAPTRSRDLVVLLRHACRRTFLRPLFVEWGLCGGDPPELHRANVSRRSRRGPV